MEESFLTESIRKILPNEMTFSIGINPYKIIVSLDENYNVIMDENSHISFACKLFEVPYSVMDIVYKVSNILNQNSGFMNKLMMDCRKELSEE